MSNKRNITRFLLTKHDDWRLYLHNNGAATLEIANKWAGYYKDAPEAADDLFCYIENGPEDLANWTRNEIAEFDPAEMAVGPGGTKLVRGDDTEGFTRWPGDISQEGERDFVVRMRHLILHGNEE